MDQAYREQFFKYSKLLVQKAELLSVHKEGLSDDHLKQLTDLETECRQVKIILDGYKKPSRRRR
jgi:hypothetical protein